MVDEGHHSAEFGVGKRCEYHVCWALLVSWWLSVVGWNIYVCIEPIVVIRGLVVPGSFQGFFGRVHPELLVVIGVTVCREWLQPGSSWEDWGGQHSSGHAGCILPTIPRCMPISVFGIELESVLSLGLVAGGSSQLQLPMSLTVAHSTVGPSLTVSGTVWVAVGSCVITRYGVPMWTALIARQTAANKHGCRWRHWVRVLRLVLRLVNRASHAVWVHLRNAGSLPVCTGRRGKG